MRDCAPPLFFLKKGKVYVYLTYHEKLAVPRFVLFFSRDKGGLHPSVSPRRFRNSRTQRTLLCTHMHVRTCHIPVVSEHPLARKSYRRRNLLGQLGELSSVSPAVSRAPDVFPTHDRKYFLFLQCTRNLFYPFTVEIALRWTRAFHRAPFAMKGFVWRFIIRSEGQ